MISAWNIGSRQAGIDFYQFWAGAQAQGRPDIVNLYDPATGARLGQEFIERAKRDPHADDLLAVARYWRVLESYSSPFLYATFKVFPADDYLEAFDVYRTICLAALVIAVAILGSLFRYSLAVTAILIGISSRFFDPTLSDIRVGNVNQLQLLGLAAACWLLVREHRWGRVSACALIAIAVLFKPDTAIAIPLLLISAAVHRRWNHLLDEVAGFAAGSFLAITVGSLSARSAGAWQQWIHRIEVFPAAIVARSGNISLERMIAFRMPLFRPSIAALIVIVLMVGAELFGSRGDDEHRSENNDLLLLTGGVAGGLLAAPLVWLHYLTLTIPAAMLLMSPARPGRARIAAAVAFVLLAASPFHATKIDLAIPMLLGLVLLCGVTVRELSMKSAPS